MSTGFSFTPKEHRQIPCNLRVINYNGVELQSLGLEGYFNRYGYVFDNSTIYLFINGSGSITSDQYVLKTSLLIPKRLPIGHGVTYEQKYRGTYRNLDLTNPAANSGYVMRFYFEELPQLVWEGVYNTQNIVSLDDFSHHLDIPPHPTSIVLDNPFYLPYMQYSAHANDLVDNIRLEYIDSLKNIFHRVNMSIDIHLSLPMVRDHLTINPLPPTEHLIISETHSDTQLTGALTDGDVLTYDTGLLNWTNKPPTTGEINDAANVGEGTGIYKEKSGVTLHFKTLTSNDSSIGISPSGSDYIDFSVNFPTDIDTSAGHKTIYRTSVPSAEGEWYYSGGGLSLRDTLVGGVSIFGVELINPNTVVVFYSKTSEKFWYLKVGKIFTTNHLAGYSTYSPISDNGIANPFVDGEETYMIVMKSHITDINLIPNVDINAPTLNQVLTYSATSKWINQAIPSGVETLGELTNVDDGVDTLGVPEDKMVLTWDNKSNSWKNLPTISSFGESGSGESIWSGTIIEGSIQLKKFESSDLSVNVTSSASTVNLATDLNRLPDTDISNVGLPLENHKHLKWDVLSSKWKDAYITIPENPADGLQNGIWIDTDTQKMKYKPTGLSEYVVSYVSPVNPYDALTTNYGARNRFKSNDIQQTTNIVTGWLDSGVTGGGSFSGSASTIYNPTAVDGKPSVETLNVSDYSYVLDLGANINTAYTMAFVIQGMTTTTGTYIDFVKDTLEDGWSHASNISVIYVAGNNLQFYFLGQLGSANYLSPPSGPPDASTTIPNPLLMIFRNANTASGSFKANFEQDISLLNHSSIQNGTIDARYIRIGSGLPGDYTACKMSEVVFWDRFLSDTEVTEVSDVLMGYYGQRTPQPIVATEANLFIEQLADVIVTAPVLTGSTLINDGLNWVNGKYDYTNLLNQPVEKSCGHITKFVGTATPTAFGEWGYSAGELRVYKFQSAGIDISYLFTAQGLYWFYSSETTDNLFAVYQLSKDSTVSDAGNYISISPINVRVGASFDPNTETLLIAQVPNVENLTELLNVNAPNPQDKQILQYNNANAQWIPVSRATGSLYAQENAVLTALTTQSTFYDITNFTTTFNSGTSVDFSMTSNGKLKYTGTRTINVRVWASISCIGSNNDEIHRIRFMREDNLGANTVELQPYQVNAYHTQRFQNSVIIAEYAGLVTDESFKIQIANMDSNTRSIFVRCIQFNVIEI